MATPDSLDPFSQVFSASTFDRAAAKRADESWVRARIADPSSRFLMLRDLRPLVRQPSATQRSEICWVDTIRARPDENVEATGVPAIFLGLKDDIAHFALAVPSDAEPQSFGWPERTEFQGVRRLAAMLDRGDAAAVAQARSLVDWHAKHRFCSRCGAPVRSVDAGYRTACTSCDAQYYPRVDPVVIMLAVHEDRCLLGRQDRHPPGMYSCLAGYVEAGESLEDAVRREVIEEAGIHCSGVSVVGNQPWPFPSTLMIAAYTQAETTNIQRWDVELEDAQWFDRARVADVLTAPLGSKLFVPPPFAIAHHLIRQWAEKGPWWQGAQERLRG